MLQGTLFHRCKVRAAHFDVVRFLAVYSWLVIIADMFMHAKAYSDLLSLASDFIGSPRWRDVHSLLTDNVSMFRTTLAIAGGVSVAMLNKLVLDYLFQRAITKTGFPLYKLLSSWNSAVGACALILLVTMMVADGVALTVNVDASIVKAGLQKTAVMTKISRVRAMTHVSASTHALDKILLAVAGQGLLRLTASFFIWLTYRKCQSRLPL
mmetsp:Transcript_3090/g.6162  ORF Transcript_3090/g.6162 Transcript_3090/m.6162 type:complete len:210 (-) Transcript_3090:108-737(-)